MKNIIFILIITITFVSCNDKNKKEATPKAKTEESTPSKTEVKKEVEEPISNNVIIEADDNMRFSKNKIVVKGGEKVKITLKHTGKMEKQIMGHNLVILKKGTKLSEFGNKANAARDTDYIPTDMKDAIVAHTKMIGGGEEVTIEFDAPEAGEYDFLCSFPAHFALMKGKFIVK